MKTQRTLIATCIAALLASSAVLAKEKGKYNEDRWGDTKSYGNVPIDQDSVNKWGPWEQFIEPEAGAPTVAFPGAGVGDPYRNLPQVSRVPVADDVCRAGDWCGYATYWNYEWSWSYTYDDGEGGYGDYYSKETRPYAGKFGLTLKPDDPSVVTIDGGEGSGQASWRLAALPGNVAPVLAASHDPMNAYFGNWWWYDTGGLHNFYASQQTSDSSAYDYSEVYGYPHNYYYYYYYYWYLPTTNKEVAAGRFYRDVYDYVSGDGAERGREVNVNGSYVAGIATPQAYLDAQRAGNVIASYQGMSADYYSGYQIPVSMTVNFGTATWSGSWNGGSDGYAYQATDSYGNNYLYGQVGFNASGTVSGANIQSTSVSANDGTVTGKVQGTFYGQTAGSIGGVHDIVKTRPEVYSASSNVGVFLVDKVQTPEVALVTLERD